jgi:hypothetical protein
MKEFISPVATIMFRIKIVATNSIPAMISGSSNNYNEGCWPITMTWYCELPIASPYIIILLSQYDTRSNHYHFFFQKLSETVWRKFFWKCVRPNAPCKLVMYMYAHTLAFPPPLNFLSLDETRTYLLSCFRRAGSSLGIASH